MKNLISLLSILLVSLLYIACEEDNIRPNIRDEAAPEEVQASQGTFADKVKVTWKQEESSYYRIYRSTNPDQRGEVIMDWKQISLYDDEQIESGALYYYAVQAARTPEGWPASGLSENVQGYGGSPTSGNNSDKAVTPGSVKASDGDYADKVKISWFGNGESYFQVYRSNSSSRNGEAISSWITATSFSDRNVDPDDLYYYRVRSAKSSSGNNPSEFSGYNRGYAKVEACEVPTDLEASDGDYSNRIRITWDGENCGYYKVYRSTRSSSNGSAITGWQSTDSYTDRDIDPGEKYYYRVKSASNSNGEGASELSQEDAGYAEKTTTGGGSSACLEGLSGTYTGSVKIKSPYTTYYGNNCKIVFDKSKCTFRMYTSRRLNTSGTYTPTPKRGDISLVHSSAWDKTGDNTWKLTRASFDAASVWLPVNYNPDQALTLASGAQMSLSVNGSNRTITIEGRTKSPYQMQIEVTVTF